VKKYIFFFAALLSLFSIIDVKSQISYSFNSQYKYLKGKDASALTSSWNSSSFNDAGWSTGPAPFRYGDGVSGTVLDDMINTYSTMYLRSSFTAANAGYIKTINMSCDFDDGFILWINGIKAESENAPDNPVYTSFSTALRESGTITDYVIDPTTLNLKEGINTIAVQGFNTSLESSDFYFDMSLTAVAEIPVPVLPRITQKPVFSQKDGFYNIPFTLTISSPVPEYTIVYTLDGSNPENSSTRIQGGISTNVQIDPSSTIGRALTPAVIVRASLIGAGLSPSFVEGRTYIFASEVLKQDYPGGDWPTSNINGQYIDLPIDQSVVNDPRYSNKIISSLKGIPSFSIITDNKNLFNPDSGIYVNAFGHGDVWERECSIELIYPNGEDGFQTNAGLRIRGGWSRNDFFAKHAFRIFFNSVYGNPKLNYPLFGDEGASKFDKFDLRCEQNYSWSKADFEEAPHCTFVREVFNRDTQRDMGQPYTRSRYYHLYLNGMYWGLYQTQERSEASYASTYFGGEDSDYDVIKVSTDAGYTIEATSGVLDTWRSIYDMCKIGFVSNSDYYNLQGKDAEGNRIPGAPVLVNIDNLIDYMLIIFYGGNFDSPTSSFGQNKGCNNFYAIFNRTLKDQGFSFFVHDAEHTLATVPVGPGIGLYEDRVNLGTRKDGMKMADPGINKFHPQWLHEKLTKNAEYRIRFADRAYNYFRPGNVLSPEASLARFNVRVSQVDPAVIAESARWGDTNGTNPPRTRDDDWIPELINVTSVYFPARSNILEDQLTLGNLYPVLKPSMIKANGIAVQSESFSVDITPTATLSFQNPNTSGDIYYTLDGSDPRLIGGNINPSALHWSDGTNILLNQSTTIKTRVLQDTVWSALNFTTILNSSEDYSKLKVTELMYNPLDEIIGSDTIKGSSLEFIEFKNTGDYTINISGMRLDSAVHSVFPPNTLLGPKQFYVVASKPGSFNKFYGFEPSANYSGNFSNGGEYVLLTDPVGNKVISFTYNDVFPWPVEADGDGYSLNSVEVNPTGDPNNYIYWKASNNFNGSPFRDDFGVSIKTPELAELDLNIYPNPASDFLKINIRSESVRMNLKVEILNMNGTRMYNNILNTENTINLRESNIGPGIYIIRVEGDNLLQTRKLIVTR
jgi:hypothetical protein